MCPSKDVLFSALNSLDDLPTIPSIMQQIEQVLHDEGSTAETIAHIISEDPSLTMKILKVANSAFYAARGARISSVKLAVSRLGLAEVSRLCQILSLIRTFKSFGSSIDHTGFWKHCLVVGMTARTIYELGRFPDADADDVYVGGLLHDIGFLILDQYFPALLRDIGNLIQIQSVPCLEAEDRSLGSTHGEIGAYIMQKWNLSPGVIQAVSFHHDCDRGDPAYQTVTRIVQVSDILCSQKGIGGVFDHEINDDADAILRELNLADRLEAIDGFMTDLFEKCDSLLES